MGESTGVGRLAPWLRRRVALLRSTTMRRSFPVGVEVVSVPVATDDVVAEAGWQHETPTLDRGLRVDLLCRLMSGLSGPVAVVVVRPGHHAARTDSDLAWTGPAETAAGVCGLDLAAVVMVSRWGWLDLLGEQRRDWKRLRIRTR